MTEDEFVEVTAELEQFFNKSLNSTQQVEWYKRLKNYGKEEYLQAVCKSYEKCKFMPKLNEIISLLETKGKINYAQFYANNSWCEMKPEY